MSQENVEAVRQRLSLRERSARRRTLVQRLAVRVPLFAQLGMRLIARLSPTSRLRQALLLRAVQDGFEASNRGDLEVVVMGYHPNVELQQPPGVGDYGELGFQPTYRGHQGYREFQAHWLSAWDEVLLEPQELIDLGDRFLVLIRGTVRGQASGVSVTQSMAVLYTFHTNGRIIREQRYLDQAEALDAVGLSEQDTHA
jgi:ketosteroid isomerase-like protein